MEWCVYQQRGTKVCCLTLEVGRGKEGFSEGACPHLAFKFWASETVRQNCCFKALNLWCFATVAPTQVVYVTQINDKNNKICKDLENWAHFLETGWSLPETLKLGCFLAPCKQHMSSACLLHVFLAGSLPTPQAHGRWLLPSSPLLELDLKGFTKQINNVNEIAAGDFRAGAAWRPTAQ